MRFTYQQVINLAKKRHPKFAAIVTDDQQIVHEAYLHVLDLLGAAVEDDHGALQRPFSWMTDVLGTIPYWAFRHRFQTGGAPLDISDPSVVPTYPTSWSPFTIPGYYLAGDGHEGAPLIVDDGLNGYLQFIFDNPTGVGLAVATLASPALAPFGALNDRVRVSTVYHLQTGRGANYSRGLVARFDREELGKGLSVSFTVHTGTEEVSIQVATVNSVGVLANVALYSNQQTKLPFFTIGSEYLLELRATFSGKNVVIDVVPWGYLGGTEYVPIGDPILITPAAGLNLTDAQAMLGLNYNSFGVLGIGDGNPDDGIGGCVRLDVAQLGTILGLDEPTGGFQFGDYSVFPLPEGLVSVDAVSVKYANGEREVDVRDLERSIRRFTAEQAEVVDTVDARNPLMYRSNEGGLWLLRQANPAANSWRNALDLNITAVVADFGVTRDDLRSPVPLPPQGIPALKAKLVVTLADRVEGLPGGWVDERRDEAERATAKFAEWVGDMSLAHDYATDPIEDQ